MQAKGWIWYRSTIGVHNLQEVHLWAIYFYSGWRKKKGWAGLAIQKHKIYLTYKHRFSLEMNENYKSKKYTKSFLLQDEEMHKEKIQFKGLKRFLMQFYRNFL